MKKTILTAITFLSLFFFATQSGAEPVKIWSKSYDGGGRDFTTGVAVDNIGNVVITGFSLNSAVFNTIKYDSNGNELWNRQATIKDVSRAVLLSVPCRLYSFCQRSIIKGVPRGVAIDHKGNVVVTGDRMLRNGAYDQYTVKYDPYGKQLWGKASDRGDYDYASGIAVDHNGNIMIAGYSSLNDDDSLVSYTIKYDPDGNEIWTRKHKKGFDTEASGIAVDSEGNIIVTGTSYGGKPGVHSSYYTIKYDAYGNKLWYKEYDGGMANEARGVTTDGDGNVIVTGEFYSSLGSDFADYYTIKYNPDGKVLWAAKYDGGEGDTASGAAADREGNIAITGISYNGNNSDYYTIKYDPDGNVLWSKSYDGLNDDIAMQIAIDNHGDVIVTGSSSIKDGDYGDYYTLKYSDSERHYNISLLRSSQ